jgi:hypothetical protein
MSDTQRINAPASVDQATVLLSLPLDELFFAPFQAAFESQVKLSQRTLAFLNEFAIDTSGVSGSRNDMFTFTTTSYADLPAADLVDSSGNQAFYIYKLAGSGGYTFDPPGVGRNTAGTSVPATDITSIDLSGQTVYVDKAGRIIVGQTQRSITLPFISILNVPSLVITEVDVDFIIKIDTLDKLESVDTNYNQFSLGATSTYVDRRDGRDFWKNQFQTGYRYNSFAAMSNIATRKSETTTESTYDVKMKARSKEPFGLKLLMDFVVGNATNSKPRYERSSDGYSLKPE